MEGEGSSVLHVFLDETVVDVNSNQYMFAQ